MCHPPISTAYGLALNVYHFCYLSDQVLHASTHLGDKKKKTENDCKARRCCCSPVCLICYLLNRTKVNAYSISWNKDNKIRLSINFCQRLAFQPNSPLQSSWRQWASNGRKQNDFMTITFIGLTSNTKSIKKNSKRIFRLIIHASEPSRNIFAPLSNHVCNACELIFHNTIVSKFDVMSVSAVRHNLSFIRK